MKNVGSVWMYSALLPKRQWFKKNRYICFVCKYTMTTLLCSQKCPLTVTHDFVLVKIANKCSIEILQKYGYTQEWDGLLWKVFQWKAYYIAFALCKVLYNMYVVSGFELQYEFACSDLKSACLPLFYSSAFRVVKPRTTLIASYSSYAESIRT